MAEYIRAKLAEIFVGDRLRTIDPVKVEVRAASMLEHGQITPISIRRTPAKSKGATPFTLVAGEYRLAAAALIGWEEIDAIIVKADSTDAQLIEIVENLHREELAPLDQAVFVLKYRELWEAKHGKIRRGGDRKSKGHDAPLKMANGRELSQDIQERLGLGEDIYKRATRIGKNIHPTLRAALRGNDGDVDQKTLLKLAKLPADDQLRVAASLQEKPDLKLALSWLKPEKASVDPQDEIFRKVAGLLEKADDDTLLRVLEHIGDKRDHAFLEAAA